MKYFVLVDCNNFYASCERIFEPRLERCPIVVLSNNDGCVVARSQEAKQCGIKMGEPFFKIKDLCERLKITVRSSNYCLYGDISERIMSMLADMSEEIQVYSIDEAFLTFPECMPVQEILVQCAEIRRLVKQWVGIPVSIGIAPSKTLAKLAGTLAKKSASGIFAISSKEIHSAILKEFPVEDIWGIGSQLKTRLYARNIRTAWEFQTQNPDAIRKLLGVVGERILWELRGVSCLPLEKAQAKKSITCSRSFGQTISIYAELAEALSTYVSRAGVKLREQNSCTRAICVFVETILDSKTGLRRHERQAMDLSYPTNDTPRLISAAKKCLTRLFHADQRYKKCGIILLDLIPKAQVIPDFFLPPIDPKREHLTKVIDNLNARFGKNRVFYGAMGVNAGWKMRSENRSKHYTTSWDDLAVANA